MADLVNEIREKTSLKILDVGGGEGISKDFFPKDEILICDLLYLKKENYLLADIKNLPFKPKSFDIVICADVLEHIGRSKRKQSFQELLRVARDYVLIGFPHQKKEINIAERLVNSLSQLFLARTNPWLEEHKKKKLPALKTIRHFLKNLKIEFLEFPNGYLEHWLIMMTITHYLESIENPSQREELKRNINEFYNFNFYPRDNRPPAYRTIFLISLNHQKKKKFSELTSKFISVPQKGDDASSKLLQLLVQLLPPQAYFSCRKNYEKEIAQMKDKLHQQEIVTNNQRSYIQQLEEKNRELVERIRGLEEHEENLTQTCEKLKDALTTTTNKLHQQELTTNNQQSYIQQLEEKNRELVERIRGLEEHEENLTQTCEKLKDALTTTTNKLHQQELTTNNQQSYIQQLEEKNRELVERIRGLEEYKENLTQTCEELKGVLTTTTNKLHQQVEQVYKLEKERQQIVFSKLYRFLNRLTKFKNSLMRSRRK
jgi:translation initiation factor 1 (eIF-1/SUI1)